MSQWERRESRPRADEEIAGEDTFHLLHVGHAASQGHELPDDQYDAFLAERAEAVARKRPLGFAPWPEELR